MPFEILMEEIRLHSDQFVPLVLDRLFGTDAKASPNAEHIAANELMASGEVEAIITTNLDECLEAASNAPRVAVPVTGSFSITPADLLKVHGTIGRPDTIAATIRGVELRAESEQWQDSLVTALRGRSILFVGYSFSDRFDLTPALLNATEAGARFCWADRQHSNRAPAPVPIDTVITHDLSDARRSVLLVLQRELITNVHTPLGTWLEDPEQLRVARAAVQSAATAAGLSAARKLESLAALLYWIEEGEAACDLFEAGHASGAAIDHHTMARAYSRARRFRAALREFDYLLRSEEALPSPRVFQQVDWCMGAGWCARASGRPGFAERYYRAADAALARANMAIEDLNDGYIADQYLRGTAGQLIRRAEMAMNSRHREELLVRAEDMLRRLAALDSVDSKTRLLQDLARAEIALTRRDFALSASILERSRESVSRWADPHTLAVWNRLLAIADPPRFSRLRDDEIREAWTSGRRLEWLKIEVERLGFGRPGPLDWLRWRIRNATVACWDLAKDVFMQRQLKYVQHLRAGAHLAD